MKINGKDIPILIVNNIKQRKTIFGGLKDNFINTYKLYMKKDFTKAMIEDIDTTDYGASVYSMIVDCFDKTYEFNLTDPEDVVLFKSYLEKYFHIPCQELTLSEIFSVASNTKKQEYRCHYACE